jgi:hypothetical protein
VLQDAKKSKTGLDLSTSGNIPFYSFFKCHTISNKMIVGTFSTGSIIYKQSELFCVGPGNAEDDAKKRFEATSAFPKKMFHFRQSKHFKKSPVSRTKHFSLKSFLRKSVAISQSLLRPLLTVEKLGMPDCIGKKHYGTLACQYALVGHFDKLCICFFASNKKR